MEMDPGSQHAGEKRGVAGLLLGRTERAARAAELQLCHRLGNGKHGGGTQSLRERRVRSLGTP